MRRDIDEQIYIEIPEEVQEFPGAVGRLNKAIYGRLVQAGRYLFNTICDKFKQSEAVQRVFRKFDDGEVEMVVFVHMDDIFAHIQTTIERFAAELGGKV